MLQMSAVETGPMSVGETGSMSAVETGPMSVAETGQMSAAETSQMSAAGTGQMSAVETRQMSAAETGQVSAVEARQMSTIATGRFPCPLPQLRLNKPRGTYYIAFMAIISFPSLGDCSEAALFCLEVFNPGCWPN